MEVVTLKRRGGIVSMNLADQNSRQLEIERKAHNTTRQELQAASRTIQDLRTQLAHGQIGLEELRARIFSMTAAGIGASPAPAPLPPVPEALPPEPATAAVASKPAAVAISTIDVPTAPVTAPEMPVKRRKGRPPKKNMIPPPSQASLPLWRDSWGR